MAHDIEEGMEIIGADGVHVGTVDRLEGDRIKLGKHTATAPTAATTTISASAWSPGDRVRLSANADVALSFEEEKSGKPVQD